MRFYLGTHKPQWLGFPEFEHVPLFISHRELRTRKVLRRSRCLFSVDSGGFTELQKFGRWTVTPVEYVNALRRYQWQTERFCWAAPQDWMCEDVVINGGTLNGMHFVGTGLSVAEHQRRTVDNLVELRALAPDLRIIPVLQGQTLEDYHRCADLYERAGIDLVTEPLVGLGSVCRRQATDEIGELVREFADAGLKLHGFGVKADGIALYGKYLGSADSLAWSLNARRDAHHRRVRGLPASRYGCSHGVTGDGACGNCPIFALHWRERVLARMAT